MLLNPIHDLKYDRNDIGGNVRKFSAVFIYKLDTLVGNVFLNDCPWYLIPGIYTAKKNDPLWMELYEKFCAFVLLTLNLQGVQIKYKCNSLLYSLIIL